MENQLLVVLGSTIDEFYQLDKWPIEGNYATIQGSKISAGGPPLNVGCVCSSHGGKVVALDLLSDKDATSQTIVKTLQEYGVDTKYIQYGDAVNCKVIIFNDKEKRTMFIEHPKRPYYIENKELMEALCASKYLYTMMHIVNRSFESLDILKKAKKKGVRILLDASAEFDKDFEKNILFTLASGVFINRDDFTHLTNKVKFDPKEKLFDNGCEFICVTDGDKGASCYTKKNSYTAKACKTEVVDSTGAGDSFAGNFIYGLLQGYDYESCLKLGCLGGSYACGVLGGQGGCCSMQELLAYGKKKHYLWTEE